MLFRSGDVPGCNCASHGLLDGNRHGDLCPYGRGWTRAWIAENRKPWGHKVTISVYLEGEREPGEPVIPAAQAAAKVFEDAGCTVDFAGATVAPVAKKPWDQVAT